MSRQPTVAQRDTGMRHPVRSCQLVGLGDVSVCLYVYRYIVKYRISGAPSLEQGLIVFFVLRRTLRPLVLLGLDRMSVLSH